MKVLLQTLYVFLCGVVVVTSRHAMRPPLPMFKHIKTDTTVSTDSAVITVQYLAPEKPHATWYVDGFPIPGNRLDFAVFNHFESWGTAILSLSREKGKQFTLCLHNTVGQTCLQLRPLPSNTVVTETLDFPWPLLTPAPRVRYSAGESVKIHAPVLRTSHNYTYSAIFLSHDPSQLDGQVVQASSRDMEGGEEGDVVTIAPVTSGSGGWMVEVNTETADYEGVLVVSTSFRPESQLVQSCTASRPITVYQRTHTAPFYPGFVAMVPRHAPSAAWKCRQGLDCLVTCPFLSNGDVTVSLTRITGRAASIGLPEGSDERVGSVWWLGRYFGKARFFIRAFNPARDSGLYHCRVSTDSRSVVSSVRVR